MRKKRFLLKEELEKLTTPRLLSYLRSLHTYHETLHWDDEIGSEVTKSSEVWKEHHKLVKEILSKREHVNG